MTTPRKHTARRLSRGRRPTRHVFYGSMVHGEPAA